MPEPMQEVYPESVAAVQDKPDDGMRMLIFQIPLPRKNIIIPMTAAQAQDLGAKLSAPSVHRPSNGRGDVIMPPGQLRG